MTYIPDVAGHAGDAARVGNDLKAALKELKIPFKEEGGRRDLWVEYTPSPSYQPVQARFFFTGNGVCSAEGLLVEVEGDVHEELRTAINHLNLELSSFRFYVGDLSAGGGQGIHVRHDLLPNLTGPSIHPRELRQALTGLCAQKAVFGDPLKRAQEGGSWRAVKDALRALK